MSSTVTVGPVLLGSAVLAVGSPCGFAQDQPAAEKSEVPKLEGPPPVKEVRLVPDLPTIPVRKGQAGFNVKMVDASLLPRDKEGIWVLDFAFKPVRMRTVDLPGKGRRPIHYLYYRVINHTGKPRMFVPQFSLVTDTRPAPRGRGDPAGRRRSSRPAKTPRSRSSARSTSWG